MRERRKETTVKQQWRSRAFCVRPGTVRVMPFGSLILVRAMQGRHREESAAPRGSVIVRHHTALHSGSGSSKACSSLISVAISCTPEGVYCLI